MIFICKHKLFCQTPFLVHFIRLLTFFWPRYNKKNKKKNHTQIYQKGVYFWDLYIDFTHNKHSYGHSLQYKDNLKNEDNVRNKNCPKKEDDLKN